MKTKDVIKANKEFRDYWGGDITDTNNLRTKKDCKRAFLTHQRWLEDAAIDATKDVDYKMKELGLDLIDL
jgi:hypothetical protein